MIASIFEMCSDPDKKSTNSHKVDEHNSTDVNPAKLVGNLADDVELCPQFKDNIITRFLKVT